MVASYGGKRMQNLRHFVIAGLTVALAACSRDGTVTTPPLERTARDAGNSSSAYALARSAEQRLRPASSYKVLYAFGGYTDYLDGAGPVAGLVEVNGLFYGTTLYGGNSNMGTIFSITRGGSEKVLHRFAGRSDGMLPESGLTNINGMLYGTTNAGGSRCGDGGGCGTIYRISTDGVEKVLHVFLGDTDGAYPEAGLINVNGTLYGTTAGGGGGPSNCCGTVFSITPEGVEKVLYVFKGDPDGSVPEADLHYAKGAVYGTTAVGGTPNSGNPNGLGTVFRVTMVGVETVLHRFKAGSDGYTPQAGLVDVGGTLYGTTTQGGGPNSFGVVYAIGLDGGERVIHRFASDSKGTIPWSDLTNIDGSLYGTTNGGGSRPFEWGVVFRMTTKGVETVLHRFAGGSDGELPQAKVIDVKGTLYGTTSSGGRSNDGVVFALPR
jgi:uncharacterized repeat protein (TIGR03803 family)